jgi:hypothetical protein
MKKLIKNGLMLLAGILVLATSCTKTDSVETGGNGTLTLKLTDAPFPVSFVDQALLTIDKIEIRSTATISSTTTVSDKESNFIVLYEGAGKEYDLLDLQNGITSDLLSLDIPAGTYDFIRMHIAGSKVVLKDGTSFDMKVPSGSSSGLKVKVSPSLVIETNVENEVVLDFDVSKSFIVQGNVKSVKGIKGFLFKPVLRAVCQKYSGILAGKIMDKATAPLAEAHVQIYRADTVYTSALTDAKGNYVMIGLPSGDYKLVCDKDSYVSLTVAPVNVKPRETTYVDISLAKVGTASVTSTSTTH